ncbi:peptide ABC transporter substrate-binding protein [Dulcicalothrix desertica PCC 7102]|uniref:Peptide ABC transporter substrate-binding protein n=1 Tax=Dulcicalothrix desertica PCC 7102 TaxID=232991 RepID=A0A3S1AYJ5_9CYAN|nr:ABC transporter substrate-binding protein [Dulcicalothrix desertica]RUT01364.1 peptide ABC transporter substrate-binding protein [Dulcicalothrix desertica PCC 7102]TWH40489.1 peptide/nickel transport system substrate-binding protein [Dulcicalothrix desertica PCC 7102]
MFLQRSYRRFVTVVLICTLFVFFHVAITSCNPSNLRTKSNKSQWTTTLLSDPKTFNFALNEEFPNVFLFIAEGLTTINAITRKIEPALAESWQFSEDNKRVTFTLRDNLKWSDGHPLTAEDVVFTYKEIVFNPDIPTSWQDTLKIGKSRTFPEVRQIDKRSVEFIFPEPFAPFLFSTTGSPDGVGILPKHVLEKTTKTKDTNGNTLFLSTWGTGTNPKDIIVNGPYLIDRYIPSQRVVFKRNPYYWRQDTQGNRLPYVERVVWEIIESTDTGVLQFRSGGLDTLTVSPENFSLLKNEEKRGDFTIYNGGPTFSKTFISFNLNTGKRQNGQPLVNPIKSRWFNNVAFRRAVAHAIDRETMLNNVFRGLGELHNSPLDIQSPYYLLPAKGLKVYEYNQELAKKLLLDAGFKYDAKNQLVDENGLRVRFTLNTNVENKTRVTMAAQIKGDLAKIGIQVDANPISFNTLVDKLNNGLDWECYLLGFTGSLEPNDGANKWIPDGNSHSFNQKPQRGQSQLIGRKVNDWEKEIGRLYIEAAQELDDNKRKQIYGKTQQITQEYLPEIYLVTPLSLVAIRNRIQNVKFSALGAQGATLWNKYELKVKE